MNRLPFQATHLRQLDLLYPSRSLWRTTLPSCRLGIVEEERLGIRRFSDVPGSLAPALYFQFLSTGDGSVLEGVFRHNERDIVTLACLSVHFSRLLEGNADLEDMEPEELYRLGLWLHKMSKHELAEQAFRRLLLFPQDKSMTYYVPLADFYKKNGQIQTSIRLWETYIERSGNSPLTSLDPFVELAMYYEHTNKDYETALHYADEALELASRKLSLSRRDDKQRERVQSLQKRVDRLCAKLSRRMLS
jgi:hypothetical protein